MSEPTWRKPAGMALLLFGITFWAVVVVTIVEGFALTGVLAALGFGIGGIAWLWLFPIRRLLLWMETGRWG